MGRLDYWPNMYGGILSPDLKFGIVTRLYQISVLIRVDGERGGGGGCDKGVQLHFHCWKKYMRLRDLYNRNSRVI